VLPEQTQVLQLQEPEQLSTALVAEESPKLVLGFPDPASVPFLLSFIKPPSLALAIGDIINATTMSMMTVQASLRFADIECLLIIWANSHVEL
jgi:hypothetical protein